MTTNVPNRKHLRHAFAALLQTALVGSGKPAQKVYRYKPADLDGKFSVVAVTSGKSKRSKQAQVSRVNNTPSLEVHTFVLYFEPSVICTNNPSAGSNVALLMSNTAGFEVGDVVTVKDKNSDTRETATVTVVTANTSITVGTLVNSYTTPSVTFWSEEDSEDRLDWLEKAISDVVMDNETLEVTLDGVNSIWTITPEGESDPDHVLIGGKEYQHEVFSLSFQLFSD